MRSKQLLLKIQTEDGRRMNRRDYILLFALLFVYSLVAFLNLGSAAAPQTVWKAEAGQTVIIDLGETKDVTGISFYGGIGSGEIGIYDESSFVDGYFRPEQTEELAVFSQDYGDMFRWETADVSARARYLVLWVQSDHTELCEIAVFSGTEQLPATVYNPQGGAERLLDEQDAVTTEPTYFDGMYFDEIYHARTAYEIVQNDDLRLAEGPDAAAENGYSIYETTHPSFGKVLIALGVRIFGMTPFGWRFMGTFFGVLILAVLYVFGKRIFRRSDYAFVTAALFSVDCMHFAQTRIATIDTYALFFTLLMFLFMGDYIAEDFEKRPYWKKLAMLGLCGLSFGLGVSSKWTCLYTGGGLALLYFGDLIYHLIRIPMQRARENKAARKREEYYERLLAEALAANDAQTAEELRANRPQTKRKKTPVNVAAYLPVLFVLVVAILLIRGTWCSWDEYRVMKYIDGHMVWKLDAQRVGVDTIQKVLLAPWFYGTLLILVGLAIASAVVFRLAFQKRDDVDLTLNNLLMTPVWCCLFFIVIPIVLYACANYCYYITDNCRTLEDVLVTLWKQQCYMYEYHAYLNASHPCQSTWYQWPLMQKSVWFYSGSSTVGQIKYISNISSTGNPAIWYVSAFGAIAALVVWFRNPDLRKDKRFYIAVAVIAGLLSLAFLLHMKDSTVLFLGLFVLALIGVMLLVYNVEKRYPREGWRDRPFFLVLTGILAGLLPWTLVTRCVFLYHYFSTIPFVMILTLLLLFYVEKKYPRTKWIKWAWLIVSAIVFVLMMPAISGIPCTKEYATFIEKVLAPFGKVYYVL